MDIDEFWGLLVIVAVVAFCVLVFFFLSYFVAEKGICLEHGYPYVIRHRDTTYCVKIENGNTVMVNVKNLRE